MLKKKQPKKNKISIKTAATLMTVLISGGIFFSSGGTDILAVSTQEQLKNAKSQKAAAQEQIDSAQATINALSVEVSNLNSELTELGAMNDAQTKLYAVIIGEMQLALQEQQKAFDMYLNSLENLEQQQLSYSQRMGVMIEYKNKSVLEVLLSSDSFSSFFTQMEMIELIGEADMQAIDRLEAAIDDAELKRQYAEDQAIAMQLIVDEKQAELKTLQNQMDMTRNNLYEKQSTLTAWEQKERDLEEQSANLESEIRTLQEKTAQEAAVQSSNTGSSTNSGIVAGSSQSSSNANGFTWPYPGYTSGSSAYGMRIHPISGVRKMHYGEDIGGSYGDKIVAAKSGTVIIASAPVAGQNTGGSSYGNYLVIDHGDGVSTLYGHCRSLYVGLGETVSAGQVIAEVGSTGASTGPHLHFEVRINGVHTNPMDYY